MHAPLDYSASPTLRLQTICNHLVPSEAAGAAVDSSNIFYDVIIVGGGVAGSATADELSRRGKKVLLLEQFHETHARGSSHGDGRIIRYAYPEDIYLKMAEISYGGWRALEQRSGERLLTICGGIDMANAANSFHLKELEQNYVNNKVAYKLLTAKEANARYPTIRVPSCNRAVEQPDYGVLWANKAVSALWHCARAQGATIISGCKVQHIKVESDTCVRVTAADGRTFSAKSLVITAGPYARELVRKSLDLDLDLEASQEVVMYFAPKANAKVSHVAGEGQMPILIDHNELKVYLLPQMDLPGVKVAMHHNPDAPIVAPDARKPVSLGMVKRVSAWVAKHLPHLEPRPFHIQTCLYTNTRDHHFLIDYHPRFSNVVIGSACSGHGFKFGPALGQILAALALHEKAPVSMELFSINANRVARRTGA